MVKAKQKESKARGKVLEFRPGPYANLGSNKGELSSPNNLVVWKETIAELEDQHFLSVEQAIQAIIDKVMKRMSALGDDEEIREFLYQLLEMDPQIVSEIQRSLRIG